MLWLLCSLLLLLLAQPVLGSVQGDPGPALPWPPPPHPCWPRVYSGLSLSPGSAGTAWAGSSRGGRSDPEGITSV